MIRLLKKLDYAKKKLTLRRAIKFFFFIGVSISRVSRLAIRILCRFFKSIAGSGDFLVACLQYLFGGFLREPETIFAVELEKHLAETFRAAAP